VHAVLATEPGPDLAIPLSGEGCGVQDLADQLDQVAIADRGGRTGPATGTGGGAAGVEAGARRSEHPAHHGHWSLGGHGYLGRFAGGICSPPLFGGGPQDRVLHGQLPDLALGLPQRPIIARPVGPLPLQAFLTALQEVVAPGGQPMGLDPSSRDSVSSGSPRSNLSTASIFLPADHLGRDR
jgi:hypothetical protein